MSEPHRPEEGPEREPDRLPRPDELVRTFLGEATLWPVAIVFFASLGSFGAALLVLAFGDRNPFAALALLLMAGMSIDIGLRARRAAHLRIIAACVGGLWLCALLLAALAVWTGIAR